jgi:hypothetical protein
MTPRGITLGRINDILAWFGLVLVLAVTYEDGGDEPVPPTRLWIETRRSYARRVAAQAS